MGVRVQVQMRMQMVQCAGRRRQTGAGAGGDAMQHKSFVTPKRIPNLHQCKYAKTHHTLCCFYHMQELHVRNVEFNFQHNHESLAIEFNSENRRWK